MAAQKNAEIQASITIYEAAKAQAKGSYSGFYPSLSVGAGYNHGTSGNDTSATDSFSTSLVLNQNIFSGLQDAAKVKQGKANEEVARLNLKIVKSRISHDLKTAYAGLLFAQGYLRLTTDSILRRESNLRMVELRYQSGRENKGSVLLSQANLAEARYQKLYAQGQIESSQQQLAKVLGNDDLTGLQLTSTAPTRSPPDTINLKQMSIETPEYLQSIQQEDISESSITIARSGFFPTLSLVASTTDSGASWYPSDNRWNLGVGITLPLFSGTKDYFASQAAADNYRASLFNRQSALRTALSRLRQTFNSYRESIEKLKVREAYNEANQLRAKIGRQKYNNGFMSFDDWDRIENELIDKQKELLEGQRDRISAESAFDQARGVGAIQ